MKQKGNADLEGFEPSRFVLKVWNHFKDNATPIGQQVLAYLVRYVFAFFPLHVCGTIFSEMKQRYRGKNRRLGAVDWAIIGK